MSKEKVIWRCKECGHKERRWSGQCLSCTKWNTFVEERELPPPVVRGALLTRSQPRLIHEVGEISFVRLSTGYEELDRIFGGGVVNGSLNLLGGEPGIGKSTLLLQLAKRFSEQGLKVLYVCGEESVEQTSLRARRLGIGSSSLYLYHETLFSAIQEQVEALSPDLLIIDSVQIVYKDQLASPPGSVTQVREVTMECMHLAKRRGITIFLIGHVTKSGDLAGPRVLEHMVDSVLEFEGDRQYGYRLIRVRKNRFGPTEDVALFQMGEQGLSEVTNPSVAFLEERLKGAAGSVVVPTLEGSRPFLIEVQALVAPSSFATPSRRSTGLDPKRLSLLLAVLEKRMGYRLHALDVFVSIAGGMKIAEPAVDLGTILALASSHANVAIPADLLVMGEVGLGGEVRSVPRVEQRLKEAVQLGFKEVLLPKKNLTGINRSYFERVSIKGISHVEEAIHQTLS